MSGGYGGNWERFCKEKWRRPNFSRCSISGSGTGSDSVWIGVLGHVGSNVENVRRGAHQVPAPKNGEVVRADYGWGMGYTGGGGSAGICRSAVNSHLHWEQTGDGGSVGGAAPNLQTLNEGKEFRGSVDQ